MVRAFLIGLLVFVAQGPVFAEIPGTARSNERDVIRLDLSLGLASPAPGLMIGTTVLRTFKPAHAYGLSVNVAHHGSSKDYERINTQAYDFVWEYSLALLEGFHALRLRWGLGAANSYVRKSVESLEDKAASNSRHVWRGHVLVSAAMDLPVADLLWFRYGVSAQQLASEDHLIQSAFFMGVVIGGQWIGVGD